MYNENMYNENRPENHELPSSAKLLKSTLLAIVAATIILVTIVLPAEYNIDPTGIGKALGLAEMGEIKTQLAEEAREDHAMAPDSLLDSPLTPSRATQLLDFFLSSAQADDAWTDEMSITLSRGEGTEIKLSMVEGATADFIWSTDQGVVNYDLHGDGQGEDKGKSISYKKGRGVPGEEGTLTAAFTGNHGWFWRNRGKDPVTVTVKVRGNYTAIKEMK